MRRLLMVLAAISFMISSSVSAQTREQPGVNRLPDGHYWLKLDKARKVQFVDGIEYGIRSYWKDVVAIRAKDSVAGKQMKPLNPQDTATFRAKDIIKKMNAVYSHTSNIRIPITFAYKYAVAELSGVSPGKLEQMLRIWSKEH